MTGEVAYEPHNLCFIQTLSIVTVLCFVVEHVDYNFLCQSTVVAGIKEQYADVHAESLTQAVSSISRCLAA